MNNDKTTMESTIKNHVCDFNRILIVEDDDIGYLLLNEILSSYQVKIARACNGQEAINYFLKDKNAAELVLMDIRLPLINGYDATRQIKEINPSVPIIAITAYAHSQGILDCFNSGCDDYMAKPIEINKVINMVENHLVLNH